MTHYCYYDGRPCPPPERPGEPARCIDSDCASPLRVQEDERPTLPPPPTRTPTLPPAPMFVAKRPTPDEMVNMHCRLCGGKAFGDPKATFFVGLGRVCGGCQERIRKAAP